MNSSYYKYCIVPQCKSTAKKTQDKLFIYVPYDKNIRRKWLKMARRQDALTLSTKSTMYFCEDHFDLPNDMINYTEYHVMGKVSQVRMKPGCIPTKFECQEDRRKRTCSYKERPYMLKKQRMSIIEECLNEPEQSSTPRTSVQDTANTSSETIVKKEISSDEETVDQTEFIYEDAATLDPVVLKFEAEEERFDGDVREIKTEVIATEEKQSEESLDSGNDIEDLIQKHIIEEQLPIGEEPIKVVVPQYLINGNDAKSRLIIQEKDTNQTNEGRGNLNKLIIIKKDQKKVDPSSLLKAVYSGSSTKTGKAKFPQVNIYDVAEFFAKDKSYTLERIAKLRDTAIPSVRAWGSALRVGSATVRCVDGALRCSCGEGGCEHRLAALLHLHKAAPPLDLEEACVQRSSTADRAGGSEMAIALSLSPSLPSSTADSAGGRLNRLLAAETLMELHMPLCSNPPSPAALLVLSGEARGVSAPSIDEFVHKSGAVLTQELCAAAREHSTADAAYARRLRGGRLDGMLASRAALSVLDRDVVRDILAPPTYNHNVDPVITYMKAVVERRLKIKVEKEGIFLRGDWPMFAATPHAVSETHVLEFHHVKPDETKSNYMFNNMFLPEYRANIHFNMFMTNRNKTYFFLSNADPTKIEVHEVHFDYAFCYDMITKCRKFWEKYVYKHIILFS